VKLLIKVGGTLLDDAGRRANLARQLAQISHDLVIVHGGGKQVTGFLAERGISSRFAGGLRVSDEAVIDAVTKVIGGSVNKGLVSALIAAGRAAVGLSGVDGGLTAAEPISSELGFVGRPARTDERLLDLLIRAGYLPVLACLAGDANGNIYNVNADQMAVSCALGWQADKLLFLTDVAGVRDASGTVLPRLGEKEIEELIRSGTAHGGMQAKLEAARLALQNGLAEVVIASGHEPGICTRFLAGQAVGSRLALEAVAP
jgi:acetylglutamate kinase